MIRYYLAAVFLLIGVLWWGGSHAAVTQERLEMPAICGSLGEVRTLVERSGSRFIARGRLDNGLMVYYYLNTEGPALQILFPVEGEHCLIHNVRVNRLEIERGNVLKSLAD